jgi:hypothetical protein
VSFLEPNDITIGLVDFKHKGGRVICSVGVEEFLAKFAQGHSARWRERFWGWGSLDQIEKGYAERRDQQQIKLHSEPNKS